MVFKRHNTFEVLSFSFAHSEKKKNNILLVHPSFQIPLKIARWMSRTYYDLLWELES